MPDCGLIKLAVEYGKLILVKQCETTTKTINGVQVQIDFRTNDWENLTKTVGFFKGESEYGVTLSAGENTCYIPWEILNCDKESDYEVGIFGIGQDIRLTTNRIKLHIDIGSYTATSASQTPTATLAAELLVAQENINSYTTLESIADRVATIELAANHGNLYLVHDYETSSKSINAVRINIDFRTNDWDDTIKTITFFRGTNSYGVVLPEDKSYCYVPWEVLDCDGDCVYKIGVFGISENMRLTTNKVKLHMSEGCYCNGGALQNPTQDIYEQILTRLQDVEHISETEVRQCIQEYCEDNDIATQADIAILANYVGTFTPTGSETTVIDYINSIAFQSGSHTHANKTVLDLITENKINAWDNIAQSNIIESIKIGDTTLTVTNNSIELPAATVERMGVVKGSTNNDKIKICADGTMEINSVNIDKLYIADGDELILRSGNAD